VQNNHNQQQLIAPSRQRAVQTTFAYLHWCGANPPSSLSTQAPSLAVGPRNEVIFLPFWRFRVIHNVGVRTDIGIPVDIVEQRVDALAKVLRMRELDRCRKVTQNKRRWSWLDEQKIDAESSTPWKMSLHPTWLRTRRIASLFLSMKLLPLSLRVTRTFRWRSMWMDCQRSAPPTGLSYTSRR